MITLKNVTKVYGTKTKVNALRGIDLNIKAEKSSVLSAKAVPVNRPSCVALTCLKDRQAAILLLMTAI